MGNTNIKLLERDTVCLHFVPRENVKSILENGILPRVGNGVIGIENSPKIYFSKGEVAALEIANVWIRWMTYNMQWHLYTLGEARGTGRDQNYFSNYEQNRQRFFNDFYEGKIYTDEVMENIYKKFYDMTKSNVYLALDLVEGEDYLANDVDEAKLNTWGKGEDPSFTLRVMYGKLTNNPNNKYCMERWNMHTKAYNPISPNKIQVIECDQGDTMLDLLEDIWARHPEVHTELELLNGFMQEKEKYKYTDQRG